MLLITEKVFLPATAVVVIVVTKKAATKPVRIIVLVLWLMQFNNFQKVAHILRAVRGCGSRVISAAIRTDSSDR